MNVLELINEITIQRIKHNNVIGFPDTKKRHKISHTVNVRNTQMVPYTNSDTLIVHANCKTADGEYETSVEFNNVDYDGDNEFRATDGELYTINRIKINVDDCKCNCDCDDFRYRFADLHNQNDSLTGDPPPPYVHKHSGRPPVNPLKVLGACKHLEALFDYLRNARIIQ
jgi:hypothetical protein